MKTTVVREEARCWNFSGVILALAFASIFGVAHVYDDSHHRGDESQAQFKVILRSPPGEWLGQGKERQLKVLSIVPLPKLRRSGLMLATAEDESTHWTIFIEGPDNSPLKPGLYENAVLYGSNNPGTPGLDVFGDGRGSNTLVGKFTIHEIDSFSDGRVKKLAIDLELHSGGENRPALIGYIRWNSAWPIPPAPVRESELF